MTAPNIIDEFHDGYIKKVDVSSKKLYDILLRVLAEYSDGGVLKPNKRQLAELDYIIKKALQDSGYSKATDTFMGGFSRLEQYNDIYYQKEGLSLSTAIKGSEILSYIQDTTIDSLRKAGAAENILKPLENIIRQDIFLNRTYTQTADLLKEKLVTNSIITRHADTIAFDALNKYNGAINNEVRVKYDLKYFFYIGSEIENTRPVCAYIRDNYKGAISFDELKVILDKFCPNGIPSEKMITYETVNGVKLTKKMGSGMYTGTTLENFCINCGGHQCRHDAKPTRFPK